MKASSRGIHKIAFVGDYLPRKCGIATFTTDLCRAVSALGPGVQCMVVPVNDIEEGYEYPGEVRFEIAEQELSSYQRAADFLNISNVDVVCVQHEFGIYGGPAGRDLLALLRDLRMPVVATLHTVLREPNPDQKLVFDELMALSEQVVVMTRLSQDILLETYGVAPEKINLIPHGIPDMPFVDPNYFKDLFGVEGKYVLLTFGLLSPNKGVEYVLKAMPAIVKEFPNTVYIVLGATHPNILREQGETYRLGLERLAKRLGIQKNVIFFNQFVELNELKEFIGAADIYVMPYLNPNQAVSGTLAYSLGAGKPVIATPFWHARELLDNDCGIVVPFADSPAIARETVRLLKDEPYRHAIRKNAYRAGREMVWSNVAHKYLQTFEKARLEKAALIRAQIAIRTLEERPPQLPDLKLDYLFQLTDSTGILQHATFSIPNYAEGYCTDDNARALILTALLEELGEDSPALKLAAARYAAFLLHAFNQKNKWFRNFLGYDRKWLESQGSEDCHGRALWALGTCMGRSNDPSIQAWAGHLFNQALPMVMEMKAPRAWAFTLIGIHEYFRKLSGDRLVNQMREVLTKKLMDLFKAGATDDWPWFEDSLAYANAKLPHALILSGRWMAKPEIFETGLKVLRWLVAVQTSEVGFFMPIGSEGLSKGSKQHARFDQQPIEAHTMISACLEAFRSTADGYWLDQAKNVFEWFLGRNDLGLHLYDPATGGCRDGLHVDRLNQNQGAESTLAFLLSLTEMQMAQNMLSTLKKPVA